MAKWETAPIVKNRWEDAPIVDPAATESTAVDTMVTPVKQEPKENYLSNLGGYWSEDLPTAAKDVWSGIKKRSARIDEPTSLGEMARNATGAKGTIGNLVEGVAGTPQRIGRTVGGATGTLGDIAGQLVVLGGKSANRISGGKLADLFTPVGKAAGSAVQEISKSQIGKTLQQIVKDLTPSEKADLASTVDMTEAFGWNPAKKIASVTVKTIDKTVPGVGGAVKQQAKKIATNENGMVALAPNKEVIPEVSDISLKDIRKGKLGDVQQITGEPVNISKVKQPGLLIKELSESESRIISEPKAPKAIPFPEYAKQAEIAKGNPKAATPNQIAGINAANAFKEVDQIKNDAGKTISKIIADNPDTKISITDVKNRYLDLVNERIGELKSGAVPVDDAAAKEADELGNFILNLPNEIDARTAWNLKRNLQGRVKYTAEGQYKPPNTLVESITKDIARQIDQNMDVALPGFKEANEAYGEVATIAQRMSKALGTEINPESGLTKHGASIMKRAMESNNDSGISEIFRAVNKLTNGEYDLFQDAAYAQIAMKHSGDPLQARKATALQETIEGIGIGKGGTLSTRVIDLGGKVGKKGYEKVTGGKLQRIVDFYNKQQNVAPVSMQPQSLYDLANRIKENK